MAVDTDPCTFQPCWILVFNDCPVAPFSHPCFFDEQRSSVPFSLYSTLTSRLPYFSFRSLGVKISISLPFTQNATRAHNCSTSFIKWVLKKTVTAIVAEFNYHVFYNLGILRVKPVSHLVKKKAPRAVEHGPHKIQAHFHSL